MAAFATPTELATFLRTATEAESAAGNPDALDTAVATLLLNGASGAIRDACGWSISQETVTGERVQLRTSGAFVLPTQRLTSLSITVGGVAASDGGDYTWGPDGIVTMIRPFSAAASVLATYTHGYATVPDGVKEVCLEMAATRYPNPSRYQSETIEGVATVYAAVNLDREPRLNRYRIMGVA